MSLPLLVASSVGASTVGVALALGAALNKLTRSSGNPLTVHPLLHGSGESSSDEEADACRPKEHGSGQGSSLVPARQHPRRHTCDVIQTLGTGSVAEKACSFWEPLPMTDGELAMHMTDAPALVVLASTHGKLLHAAPGRSGSGSGTVYTAGIPQHKEGSSLQHTLPQHCLFIASSTPEGLIMLTPVSCPELRLELVSRSLNQPVQLRKGNSSAVQQWRVGPDGLDSAQSSGQVLKVRLCRVHCTPHSSLALHQAELKGLHTQVASLEDTVQQHQQGAQAAQGQLTALEARVEVLLVQLKAERAARLHCEKQARDTSACAVAQLEAVQCQADAAQRVRILLERQMAALRQELAEEQATLARALQQVDGTRTEHQRALQAAVQTAACDQQALAVAREELQGARQQAEWVRGQLLGVKNRAQELEEERGTHQAGRRAARAAIKERDAKIEFLVDNCAKMQAAMKGITRQVATIDKPDPEIALKLAASLNACQYASLVQRFAMLVPVRNEGSLPSGPSQAGAAQAGPSQLAGQQAGQAHAEPLQGPRLNQHQEHHHEHPAPHCSTASLVPDIGTSAGQKSDIEPGVHVQAQPTSRPSLLQRRLQEPHDVLLPDMQQPYHPKKRATTGGLNDSADRSKFCSTSHCPPAAAHLVGQGRIQGKSHSGSGCETAWVGGSGTSETHSARGVVTEQPCQGIGQQGNQDNSGCESTRVGGGRSHVADGTCDSSQGGWRGCPQGGASHSLPPPQPSAPFTTLDPPPATRGLDLSVIAPLCGAGQAGLLGAPVDLCSGTPKDDQQQTLVGGSGWGEKTPPCKGAVSPCKGAVSPCKGAVSPCMLGCGHAAAEGWGNHGHSTQTEHSLKLRWGENSPGSLVTPAEMKAEEALEVVLALDRQSGSLNEVLRSGWLQVSADQLRASLGLARRNSVDHGQAPAKGSTWAVHPTQGVLVLAPASRGCPCSETGEQARGSGRERLTADAWCGVSSASREAQQGVTSQLQDGCVRGHAWLSGRTGVSPAAVDDGANRTASTPTNTYGMSSPVLPCLSPLSSLNALHLNSPTPYHPPAVHLCDSTNTGWFGEPVHHAQHELGKGPPWLGDRTACPSSLCDTLITAAPVSPPIPSAQPVQNVPTMSHTATPFHPGRQWLATPDTSDTPDSGGGRTARMLADEEDAMDAGLTSPLPASACLSMLLTPLHVLRTVGKASAHRHSLSSDDSDEQ